MVKDVNLTIRQGEIVGLLGPNGAGKTTTLRMIAGVLPATKGSVVIDEQEMKKHGKDLKKMIGFLPEENPLYEEMTVEEYLRFWADIKGIPDQKKALDFVVKHAGISEVYYRRIAELSKGFRQRVGLSQAILSKPQILILDEPTEGLDPNQRQEIQKLIKSLGKKRTVIIASHVLSEVSKLCNRIIIIHKGKIVADDTAENLRKAKSKKQIIEAEIKGKRVISTLKSIKGVSKVSKRKNDYFVLETSGKEDLRQEIFKTAVKKRWTLLTLLKKEMELEDIFAKLTKD